MRDSIYELCKWWNEIGNPQTKFMCSWINFSVEMEIWFRFVFVIHFSSIFGFMEYISTMTSREKQKQIINEIQTRHETLKIRFLYRTMVNIVQTCYFSCLHNIFFICSRFFYFCIAHKRTHIHKSTNDRRFVKFVHSALFLASIYKLTKNITLKFYFTLNEKRVTSNELMLQQQCWR